MDVHCTTCGEPWDVDHLWHEAIFDTTLSPEEAQAWCKLPQRSKLAPRYRAKFEAQGWKFGRTVLNVVRCPCCPDDAHTDLMLWQGKSDLEALFEDDPDGLAAAFEDLNL